MLRNRLKNRATIYQYRSPGRALRKSRKLKSEMLRQAQHDESGGFWGVILSSSKDLGVMQRSPLQGGPGWLPVKRGNVTMRFVSIKDFATVIQGANMAVKGLRWLAGVGLFLSILSGVCSAEGSKTVEVWKNLFTVINGDGIDSNTTFLITREGVVVIDTRVTPMEADKVLKEIRKQTDLPILYTINTHYHGDHTFGNQVFKDSKAIIAIEHR